MNRKCHNVHHLSLLISFKQYHKILLLFVIPALTSTIMLNSWVYHNYMAVLNPVDVENGEERAKGENLKI